MRTRADIPTQFPFGPRSALLLAGMILSLQNCLNYPSRINYGAAYTGEAPQENGERRYEAEKGTAEAGRAERFLLSSHLVMELSHKQLEALDVKQRYGSLRRYPVQVYRITYRSKNFPRLSALVLLPMGMDIAEYSVLAHHHGTLLPFPSKRQGAYEAPSFFGSRYRKGKKFFSVNSYGLPAASLGYLTVMPDYMGYGVQGGEDHPFMIGPELGQESIDALRAVYQWGREKGLKLRPQIYLTGVSEGAYAAMWSQQFIEEAQDFSGFRVSGAYYAGPYHLSSMLKKIIFEDGKVNPLFNWALYATWDYYFRDASLRRQRLQAYFPLGKYQQLLRSSQSWSKEEIWLAKVPNVLSILLLKPMAKEKLFQPSFLEELNNLDSDFWTLAGLLDIHRGWQPKGPIYLYHNDQDPLIPWQNSADAQRELRSARKSGQVSLESFERQDHVGGHWRYLQESLAAFSRTSGLLLE